jgi:hypothetical protein
LESENAVVRLRAEEHEEMFYKLLRIGYTKGSSGDITNKIDFTNTDVQINKEYGL